MLEINKIYNLDCREGFKLLENNSVDIVITSPPYNAGENVRGNFYENYSDNLEQEQYYIFIKEVITELIRVSKYYVFFNFQILSNNKIAYLRILNDFKDNIKEIIIWHKKQVQPAIQPTCLSSAFEFIIVFSKPEYASKRTFERAFFNNRLKGQLNLNVLYGNSCAIHELNTFKGNNKAVFPQYLVRHFLKKFSDVGDIVLDPFMGSGTVADVCKQLGRSYIGFEIDKNQINISQERLQQKTLIQNNLDVEDETDEIMMDD